jgi:two-component system, sensor histidine kinase RegB
VAIAGQAIIICAARWALQIPLPLVPLFLILTVEVSTNAVAAAWARRQPDVQDWMLCAVMAFDVVLLTLLLYLTGGAYNPFSFLYVVHIALAAVVLRSPFTWALVALALAGFGSLFLLPAWTLGATADAGAHGEHLRLHLQGMWVAFGVAAGFIVYFVQRVRRALSEREAELVAARELTARNEKFASLATLAAGAAHELSTPLSTIAVVAKELEHQLDHNGSATAVTDVRLIREQVSRCRDILQQMAADAGQGLGEISTRVAVEEVVRVATNGALAAERIVVSITERARGRSLQVPPRALAQALRGVLKNAVQASPADRPVYLHVDRDADVWQIEVRDRGTGMPSAILQRAGEPFFTTKSPGQGMGLGLFLTRAVLARLGGRLDIESRPGHGTTARLVLIADAQAQE